MRYIAYIDCEIFHPYMMMAVMIAMMSVLRG